MFSLQGISGGRGKLSSPSGNKNYAIVKDSDLVGLEKQCHSAGETLSWEVTLDNQPVIAGDDSSYLFFLLFCE